MSVFSNSSRFALAGLVLPALLVAVSQMRGERSVPPTGHLAETVVLGAVTDAETSRPLANVLVEAQNLRLQTTTDRAGRYRLVLPRALDGAVEVTLAASSAGYEKLEKALRLESDSLRVDFVLTRTERRPAVLPEAGKLLDRAMEAAAFAPGAHMSLQATGVRADAHSPIGPGGDPAWPPFNTEEYDRIYENPFLSVAGNPMSTFSIDVDAASYSNVRRFLMDGTMPPADAVRIEELINYFDYAYPEPAGNDPLSITLEMAPAPWQPAHRLVHIGLQGRRVDAADLPPSNLVFLLDVSGSMASADKLPLLKSALRMLVNQLRPEDRVSIVVYAGAAGLVLPPTSGEKKSEIRDALENLEAGGSTAGGAGIQLAYRVAREHFDPESNNRVILATDGDFNIGPSSTGELIRMVEEQRDSGIFLTVLGFGTGNLKDSRMEQLANKGNGHYAYIDSILEAKKVLVSELGATLLTVAKDVKLQIEFNPAQVAAYRLIGYENRLLRNEDFNDDTKDAGELGAGHTVTALYEVIPVGADSPVEIRGTDSLRYGQNGPARRPGLEDEWLAVKLRYKQPDQDKSRLLTQIVRDGAAASVSDDYRFSAAVAAFGMLLRGSEYSGEASYEQVIDLARRGLGADPHGYRRAFLDLVEVAQAVVG